MLYAWLNIFSKYIDNEDVVRIGKLLDVCGMQSKEGYDAVIHCVVKNNKRMLRVFMDYGLCIESVKRHIRFSVPTRHVVVVEGTFLQMVNEIETDISMENL